MITVDGVPFHIESTGGGGSALVNYREDGAVEVITDGSHSHLVLGAPHALVQVFDSREAWEDSGSEPAVSVERIADHETLDGLLWVARERFRSGLYDAL